MKIKLAEAMKGKISRMLLAEEEKTSVHVPVVNDGHVALNV